MLLVSFSTHPSFLFPPFSISFAGFKQDVEEILEQSQCPRAEQRIFEEVGWVVMSAYSNADVLGCELCQTGSTAQVLRSHLGLVCLQHLITLLFIVGPRTVKTIGSAISPIRLYRMSCGRGSYLGKLDRVDKHGTHVLPPVCRQSSSLLQAQRGPLHRTQHGLVGLA